MIYGIIAKKIDCKPRLIMFTSQQQRNLFYDMIETAENGTLKKLMFLDSHVAYDYAKTENALIVHLE